MNTNEQLVRDLPVNLERVFQEKVMQDEKAVISLPGAYGEAFILTCRRVMILREDTSSVTSSDRVNAYIYPVGRVQGAKVGFSGIGGSLSLSLTDSPKEVEAFTVFFPSYEQSRFEAAAAVINQLAASDSHSTVSSLDTTVPAQSLSGSDPQVAAGACPSCGTSVDGRSIFCQKCGVRLHDRCINCGSMIVTDEQFCTGCGLPRVEAVLLCPGCGTAVEQSWHNYCPKCGHILGQRCASCSSPLRTTWQYCAGCGRQVGSETATPVQSLGRYTQRVNAKNDHQRTEEPVSFVEEIKAVGGTESASEHNQRGKELFDQEQIEVAIEEFRKAVLLDPSNAAYHCNLAVAYDEMDMDELAVAEYEAALKLNPTDTTALLYVGYMYSENDEMEKAEQMWRKVIEVAPGSAEAQEARECLEHRKDL